MTREERSHRSDYSYFRPIATRWADNDIYGHVNNVVYYQWFDTLVNGWLIEGGHLDPTAGQSINLVVETSCRYFESVAYPETVEAGMAVTRLGTSSVVYAVAIFRQGSALAAAQGRFVHIAVDRVTRRPRPIPAPMRAALEALQRPTGAPDPI